MSVLWIGGQVVWSTYSDEKEKARVLEDDHGLYSIIKLPRVSYHFAIDKEQMIMTRK